MSFCFVLFFILVSHVWSCSCLLSEGEEEGKPKWKGGIYWTLSVSFYVCAYVFTSVDLLLTCRSLSFDNAWAFPSCGICIGVKTESTYCLLWQHIVKPCMLGRRIMQTNPTLTTGCNYDSWGSWSIVFSLLVGSFSLNGTLGVSWNFWLVLIYCHVYVFLC